MPEAFKIHKAQIYKAHKMLDYIENEVTVWALALVTDHFEVETAEELSRDQIDEVVAEYYGISEYDRTLGLGFRNVIGVWENEHAEYVL